MQTTPIGDAYTDALRLWGLAQGLDILVDEALSKAEATPASEAVIALSRVLIDGTRKLTDDLARIEDQEGRAQRKVGD